MSRMQRAPPWSESEKIALLVEISRDAGQDPVVPLVRALPYNGPEPRWDEISIPPGRNLRSCKEEYEEIRKLYHGRPIQPHPASYQPSHPPIQSAPPTAGKRTFQEAEGQSFFPTPLQLPNLQPRPQPQQSFSSLSPVVQPANTDLAARRPSPLSTGNKPKGKPGRPSKEEIARRQAELAAEGKVYAPQQRKRNKPKKPQPLAASPLPVSAGASGSTEASSVSMQTPPRQPVELERSSSSGRRKRQRLDDPPPGPDDTGSNEPAAAEGPTASGSAPAHVAQSPSDRVRPDTKFAPKSTSAASNDKPGDGSEIVDSEVKLRDPSSRTSHASFEI